MKSLHHTSSVRALNGIFDDVAGPIPLVLRDGFINSQAVPEFLVREPL